MILIWPAKDRNAMIQNLKDILAKHICATAFLQSSHLQTQANTPNFFIDDDN